MLRLLVCCAAVIALSCWSSLAIAQATTSGQPRQLAPGVLTVIPPTIEEEETHSGPQALTALTDDPNLSDWTPYFNAPSNTLRAMAARSTLRRDVWQVEFAFKPLRMIEVDVPQANGLLQRKLIWYMVFRVRNTGSHLSPVRGQWQRDDAGNLLLADVPVGVDPQSGEAILLEGRPNFLREDAAEDDAAGDSPYGVRRVDFDVRCFLSFALRSHEFDKEYLDRLIPVAIPAIQEREDPSRPLLSTVEIGQQWLQVSQDESDGLWGVATWVDIDPQIDFFSVYVQGLTNAYRWQEAEGGDSADQFRSPQKTLQLNFWRTGDALAPREEEIHYGMPPADARRQGPSVLELYGVERRLDYDWVYR